MLRSRNRVLAVYGVQVLLAITAASQGLRSLVRLGTEADLKAAT
jgi:hypothetical protein